MDKTTQEQIEEKMAIIHAVCPSLRKTHVARPMAAGSPTVFQIWQDILFRTRVHCYEDERDIAKQLLKVIRQVRVDLTKAEIELESFFHGENPTLKQVRESEEEVKRCAEVVQKDCRKCNTWTNLSKRRYQSPMSGMCRLCPDRSDIMP